MDLTTDILTRLDDPDLSLSDHARRRCALARHHEQSGEYDAASEVLGQFWSGVGARPNLEGLHDADKAEVLLRAGALTGWIGSASKIEGAQEAAKDLITEALELFHSRGMKSKAGEARSDLALCYWRAGAHDEARVMLEEAFREIDERNTEQRAVTILRQALVERASGRLNEALRIYKDAQLMFDSIRDH